MRLTSTPPWAVRPLSVAIALVALLVSCSPQDEEHRTDGTTAGEEPASPTPSVSEILGIDASQPRETADQKLPPLGWEEASEGLPKGGTWRQNPLLADFDGDGRAELVASNREEDGLNAWTRTQEGRWIPAQEGFQKEPSLMYGGSAVADLDGDGDLDLVFASHLDGLRVYENLGELRWREAPRPNSPNQMLDVATGNLDGDAHPDFAGICHFAGAMHVYRSDPSGRLVLLPESSRLAQVCSFGTRIRLEDIDGDGIDDILATTDKGALCLLTVRGEDGSLAWENLSAGLPKPKIGNSLRGIVAADFIEGGRPEIAVGGLVDVSLEESARLGLGIYAWDESSGSWQDLDSGLPRGMAVTDVSSADFDEDGHADLLVLFTTGESSLFLGDGQGGFTLLGAFPRLLGGTPHAALGDVNGDGHVDVALLHAATKLRPNEGGLRVFLNPGPEKLRRP